MSTSSTALDIGFAITDALADITDKLGMEVGEVLPAGTGESYRIELTGKGGFTITIDIREAWA